MPTPLETYLTDKADKSYLQAAFAIGSDNDRSQLLLEGMKKYRGAMPQTLAGHCVGTGTAWSQTVNDTWVKTMLDTTGMKTLHIFHLEICKAIGKSEALGKLSASVFSANFGGNRTSPTFKEIMAIIEFGFDRIEYAGVGSAILTRE